TTPRRDFLWSAGGGLGGLALASLLGTEGLLADVPRPKLEFNGGLHHKARVKRGIQLFMNRGVRQMDTFDYKPELVKQDRGKVDFGLKAAATSVPGNVMKCPFAWKQYGQSGRWVSGVLPYLTECVDDLAFLMAMQSKTNVHGPGSYMQNTGFLTPGFPCMGAWISYGLGRLTDNLPAFVVLPDSRGLPYNQGGNFSSGFLPVAHQGTAIRPTAPVPISDLFPPKNAAPITPARQAHGLPLP